jgi:Predicted outer membrane protein
MKTITALVCAGLAWSSLDAFAANADVDTEPVVTTDELDAPGGDERFVVDACQGNVAEIQLADLALKKSSDARVRDLAEHIKKDHTAAQEELQVIATGLNIEVPSEPSAAQKRTYERLSGLEGSEFDEAYLHEMEKEHSATIRTYERVAGKTETPAVRAYAEKTLEALKAHHAKTEAAQPGE